MKCIRDDGDVMLAQREGRDPAASRGEKFSRRAHEEEFVSTTITRKLILIPKARIGLFFKRL